MTLDREELARLVDRADLDALLRAVEQEAAAGDWDGLLALRDACRYAHGTGRQLWPAAGLAEYRIALGAPGPWAAQVVVDGSGLVSPGPLSEVAASSHTWADLAPHLPGGPARAFVAHERVLRGEDLRGDTTIDPHVLDLPLALAAWEPAYPLAEFGPSSFEAPPPERPPLEPVDLPPAGQPMDDEDTRHALRELVSPWTAGSNGRVDLAAVGGSHLVAIAALGVPAARVAGIGGAEAMAWLAWAGASGGAHGRRRGGAAGRFGAWWAAAALGGVLDEWPLDPGDLGEVVESLRWFVWDAHEPATGWQLRLAVWDADEGLAWAINATDAA